MRWNPENKRLLVGTGKAKSWACGPWVYSCGGRNMKRFLTGGFWSAISRAMAMS